jgi:hypothetical protein
MTVILMGRGTHALVQWVPSALSVLDVARHKKKLHMIMYGISSDSSKMPPPTAVPPCENRSRAGVSLHRDWLTVVRINAFTSKTTMEVQSTRKKGSTVTDARPEKLMHCRSKIKY